MKISLLRGRIAVRPIVDAKIGSIFMPDIMADWTRSAQHRAGLKSQACHRAKVLGKGPPAFQYGRELPHGFDVGDTVVFVYAHNEKWSDGHVWEDGEPCMYISQEEVQAVYE